MKGAFGLMDRYVLRRVVAAYGLCLLGFLLLFLVIDFFGNLDEFLGSAKELERAGESLWRVVGEYYVTKVPIILTLVGPFLTLFAGIVTLMSFARHNELVPMVAAGRSLHRVLLPMYVFAVAVVGLLVFAEEAVVPYAMKQHAILDRLMEERGKAVVKKVPHLRDGTNVLDVDLWMPGEQKMVRVRTPAWQDPVGRLPTGSLTADELQYRRHPGTGVVAWYPVNGVLRPQEKDADGRVLPPIRLSPEEAIQFRRTPNEVDLAIARGSPGLTRAEIAALRKRDPEAHGLWMQLLARTTRPVSSVVLLLLGIPFVTRPGQRTIAAGLAVALGASVAYFGVDFFFQQLGNRNTLPPPVAAWFAPIFFGALAISRLDRVSRV